MASPEQPLAAFENFFKENPNLFEPLKNIPVPEPGKKVAQSLSYEPANEAERRLLLIIEDHQNSAAQALISGRFNPMRALGTPEL